MTAAGRPTISCRLKRAGGVIGAAVVSTRPNSLVVRFDEARDVPNDGTTFSEVSLDLGADEISLGSCRFERDGAPAGRLIFNDRVYDFSGLLPLRRISDLRQRVEKLPLAWNRRTAIGAEFREFVADLLFDLQVYRAVFDELDAQLAGESPRSRAELQALAREQEYPRFRAWFRQRLSELERLAAPLGRARSEQHGFYFRKQLRDFIQCSELLARTNAKPRGYAGDSEVMRLIYENAFRGPTIFSQFMHRYPLELAAAQAVRNRRRLVADWMRERALARAPGSPLRVLSVACGPAEELQEVVQSPQDAARIQFTLLDQDPQALEEARQLIGRIERSKGVALRADYVCASVRTMQQERVPGIAGPYDFVYSMGLFDYLTETTAAAILSWMYGGLSRGGDLIIGNFHPRNPSRTFMEYWADWTLWYRSESELMRLADALRGARAVVSSEESGCQLFLHVTRHDEA